jgi:hypothetical protein
MAITYLTESHKCTCWARNGNVEVQDLPQDDSQDREMNSNEGNEEGAEENEPNSVQDNRHHNQVSLHLHNPHYLHWC